MLLCLLTVAPNHPTHQQTFSHKLYPNCGYGFISIWNLCTSTTGTYFFAMTGRVRPDKILKKNQAPGNILLYVHSTTHSRCYPPPLAWFHGLQDSTGTKPNGRIGDHNSHGNDSFSPDKASVLIHLSRINNHIVFLFVYICLSSHASCKKNKTKN